MKQQNSQSSTPDFHFYPKNSAYNHPLVIAALNLERSNASANFINKLTLFLDETTGNLTEHHKSILNIVLCSLSVDLDGQIQKLFTEKLEKELCDQIWNNLPLACRKKLGELKHSISESEQSSFDESSYQISPR